MDLVTAYALQAACFDIAVIGFAVCLGSLFVAFVVEPTVEKVAARIRRGKVTS